MSHHPSVPRHRQLIIAHPMYQTVTADWFRHYEQTLIPADMPKVFSTGAYVSAGMNEIVRKALQVPGWRYLVVYEQDMYPPQGWWEHMLNYRDQPIVGALYFRKNLLKPDPVAYYWSKDGMEMLPAEPFRVMEWIDRPGLYECDVVGMGLTAIHRDVLEAWPAEMLPRFATPSNPSGEVVSHDAFFCRRAQGLGHHVFVDSAIPCGHETRALITKDTYRERQILDAIAREEAMREGEVPKILTLGDLASRDREIIIPGKEVAL